jgi:hypothetical protein
MLKSTREQTTTKTTGNRNSTMSLCKSWLPVLIILKTNMKFPTTKTTDHRRSTTDLYLHLHLLRIPKFNVEWRTTMMTTDHHSFSTILYLRPHSLGTCANLSMSLQPQLPKHPTLEISPPSYLQWARMSQTTMTGRPHR